MNVLLTITSYPPAIGGTQAYAHELARRLVAERGHRVAVATFWDRTRHDWLLGTTLAAERRTESYEIDGVPVTLLGLSAGEKRALLPFVLGYYAVQGPAIRRIARLIAAKLQAMGRDWDVVHHVRQGREGLAYASLYVARSLGVPFALTPAHHPRWSGWLHRHYQALYRQADAVLALTCAEREQLAGFGVAREHIHVTGMGPVLAEAADGAGRRRQLGLGSEPVVLFLGIHYRYKGLAALLAAAPLIWERFPSARFVLAGPQTAYARRLLRGHDDPRLLSLGPVSLQAKTDTLAACDVLCVPSTQESFGAVYAEAWALGKPVIGGDIPALREVITHGVDGLLVHQDPAEVAGAILALLADPDRRERMGQAGRAKVAERYAWDHLVTCTEQVYAGAKAGRP